MPAAPPPGPDVPPVPTFGEALRVWAKIGLLGFGGPAGQIALMHRELVEKRRWIGEGRFLHALSYCTLLPGPEATQLATYVGWLLHRTPGGLAAGTLFVLPGALVVLALSATYATLHTLPAVAALFLGVKAAVLAIVAEALLRVGRRALTSRVHVGVAAAAFVALAVLAVPFPLVIAAAGAIGLLLGEAPPLAPAGGGASEAVIDRLLEAGRLPHVEARAGRTVVTVLVWLALWWAPVAALALIFGAGSVFVAEGIFFGKAAVVTFGGAYAVLAYVGREAVQTFGWLLPGEMLDGLGLAETTPGPLILVLEFVAFLGGARHGAGLPPLLAGALGAAVAVWATFVPCFLWIFAGAPYIEALRGNRRLRAALSAITAAVVGVIANLAVWFARQTLDPVALAIAVLAFVALVRWKVGLGWVLGACAAAGAIAALVSH